MPRGRMLNKKVCFDEEVAKLSLKSTILFTFCIPNLDVEGKILADLHYLKGNVVPYRKDFSIKDIQKCLDELSQSPLIVVYGNGHKYMKFLGFDKNQTVRTDREGPSEIPDPTPAELQRNSSGTPAELRVKLSKVKLNIREGANAPKLSDFEFLETLKTNLAYKHINLESELAKMDAWLLIHPGRQKTRPFIVKWLNRVETPLKTQPRAIKPPERPVPVDPKVHAEVSKLIKDTVAGMGKK